MDKAKFIKLLAGTLSFGIIFLIFLLIIRVAEIKAVKSFSLSLNAEEDASFRQIIPDNDRLYIVTDEEKVYIINIRRKATEGVISLHHSNEVTDHGKKE